MYQHLAAEDLKESAMPTKYRTCSIDDCGQPHRAVGLCASHYSKQWRQIPRARAADCSVDGCVSESGRRGLCCKHYKRWRKHGDVEWEGHLLPVSVRLWRSVDKCGPEWRPGDRCWTWTGTLSSTGYGRISDNGVTRPTHVLTYQWANGPIPDGLVIDHLCRNTVCCNPAHLEPVTNRVNVLRGVGITAVNARKTHCKRGHPFDEANTKRVKKGRECRTCRRLRKRGLI